MTYHLEETDVSYGANSDFYNTNEVVDSDNLTHFLKLDYRERDFSDTLKEQGYFLIGEKVHTLPNYIQSFLRDHSNHILNHKLKEIKRTIGSKSLVYVKLDLDRNIVEKIKRNSKEVGNIINGLK